jgi:foldase protein PrsA
MLHLSPVILVTVLLGCAGSRTATEPAGTNASVTDADEVGHEIDAASPAIGGVARRGTPVVRVGPLTVTRAAFAARMEIEARSQTQPGRGPLVPVPPAFSSCVAQLAAFAAGFGTSSSSQDSKAHLRAQCRSLYEKYRTNVLTELISAGWVLGGAAEAGLRVSDAEVRSELQRLRKAAFPSEATYREYLKASGETLSDLLFATKVQMLSAKLRQRIYSSLPPVTTATVAGYYAANKAKFTVAEERDLGFLRTRHAATAPQIKRELESGVSFATIAKRLAHEQPYYTTAGLLKALKPHIIQQRVLNDAIFAARPHAISGPIRLNLYPGYQARFHRNPADINNIDGYYVFEVQAIRPAHTKPLATVEDAIKRELPTVQQRQALSSFIRSWRARWRAKTDCASGYVVHKCRQFKPVRGEPAEDLVTLN